MILRGFLQVDGLMLTRNCGASTASPPATKLRRKVQEGGWLSAFGEKVLLPVASPFLDNFLLVWNALSSYIATALQSGRQRSRIATAHNSGMS